MVEVLIFVSVVCRLRLATVNKDVAGRERLCQVGNSCGHMTLRTIISSLPPLLVQLPISANCHSLSRSHTSSYMYWFCWIL